MTMRPSFPPLNTPALAGAGLKPEHGDDILAGPRRVDFFEIHAENYMGAGGPPHHLLRRICADYPLSIHGVGLSIGGASALDREHLKRLKRLIDIYQPALFSEHLAWSTPRRRLPQRSAAAAVQRGFAGACLRSCQPGAGQPSACGCCWKIPSTYVVFGNSTMTEIEFLRAVAQRTGCGLLLDVNNVHVSAINHGFDAAAYIDAFPMQHVGEFHLAGFAEDRDSSGARLLIDDHGCPVGDVVWDLYRRAFARRHAPTLIEWDNNVPPFAVLAAEVERARRLMAAPAVQRAA